VVNVSRLGVLFTVVLGAFALGCGSDDPAPDASPGETPDVNSGGGDFDLANVPDFSPEGEFAISLPAHSIEMTALAEVKVNEGDPDVHVSITGRTNGSDVIVIDLLFNGLENTLGEHHVRFGLPSEGEHMVNGSLDGTWYYSQGGQITVSLSAEHKLEGGFDIELARGDMGAPPGEAVVFAPSAESTPLVGSFSIPWELSCHSRLPGHSVYQFGGEYCQNLDF
jgi:hypothetical protein